MTSLIHTLLDWSEVWAILIPLPFMLKYKSQPLYMKPIRIFIWLSLILHIAILMIWKYQDHMPYEWLKTNNYLYNIISIVRFFMFSWFFILLNQQYFKKLKMIVPVLFGIFILVNFIFLEDFFYHWSFSSRLISLELGLLLLYCLQYYFLILTEETSEDKRPPSFWVVTGLSIYVVINFPIVLFYQAFLKQFENFAVQIWDITNISFILLCILIAKAFYDSRNK